MKNRSFPQLHKDAPAVPKGLEPRRGVEFGCGKADCEQCYEPIHLTCNCDQPDQIQCDQHGPRE